MDPNIFMVILQEITDIPDKDVSQVIIDKVNDIDMAHERRDSNTSQEINISSSHCNVSPFENNTVFPLSNRQVKKIDNKIKVLYTNADQLPNKLPELLINIGIFRPNSGKDKV